MLLKKKITEQIYRKPQDVYNLLGTLKQYQININCLEGLSLNVCQL